MSIKIDRIIRSSRRSISLEITRDAQVIVRIPRDADLEHVRKFVMEKRAWINKKINEARNNIGGNIPKQYVEGEKFYYLGEEYPLTITKAQSPKLKFNNGFFLEEENSAVAKQIFIRWYRRQAKLNIPKRVRWFAVQHNLSYGKLRITSASGRWGSCSGKGNINFTWKLILLPLKIIDYVVVHELAHLKQHNHSKRFWAEVERMMPDYNERRKWLKKFGHTFDLR